MPAIAEGTVKTLRAALRWADMNAERALMLPLYAFMAMIIGGEVVIRYFTGTQTQWGGTVAIHTFVFVSWLGCAYHVRRRSHLGFDAVRQNMPPHMRCLACIFDDLLWIALSSIVIVYSWQMMQMQMMLESTVEGTDTFPLWIATATVPFSWSIIALRALQNLFIVVQQMWRGDFEGVANAPQPLTASDSSTPPR